MIFSYINNPLEKDHVYNNENHKIFRNEPNKNVQ